MPKVEIKVRSNCSEWDTAVESEEYKDNYSESNYPEIEEIKKEASEVKEWD